MPLNQFIQQVKRINIYSEKGSALPVVMMISAIMLSVMGGFSLMHSHRQALLHKERYYEKYQRLVNRIHSQITNPEVIKLSLTNQPNNILKGNKVLISCLTGEPFEGEVCERKDLSGISSVYDLNSSNLHLINVYPAPGAFFSTPDHSEHRNAGANSMPASLKNRMNCPEQSNQISVAGSAEFGASSVVDTTDPSCLIAGQIGESGVQAGYSIDGDTGALGPCFPYEVQVFFQPYCGTNLASSQPSSCLGEIASAIDLQFIILERSGPAPNSDEWLECPEYEPLSMLKKGGYLRGPIRLGNRPRNIDWQALSDQPDVEAFGDLLPNWYRMSADSLIGARCNPGATVLEFNGFEPRENNAGIRITQNGGLKCECSYPWKRRVPLEYNARGILCDPPDVSCPQGFEQRGRNQDGSPNCVDPSTAVAQSAQSLVFGTLASSGSSGEVVCENQGWIESLTTNCGIKSATVGRRLRRAVCSFFYEFNRNWEVDGKPVRWDSGLYPDMLSHEDWGGCRTNVRQKLFFNYPYLDQPLDGHEVDFNTEYACWGVLYGIFILLFTPALVAASMLPTPFNVAATLVIVAAIFGATSGAYAPHHLFSMTCIKPSAADVEARCEFTAVCKQYAP